EGLAEMPRGHDPANIPMQEITRAHRAASMRVRHPFRNREHNVDDVPGNRIEIVGQRAAVSISVEICRTAQHSLDDDVKRRTCHPGGGVWRDGAVRRPPTVDLALRHCSEDWHKRQQRFMPEDRSYRASLPAPFGALSEKKGGVADDRSK